jgi:hypothetical protein
MTIRELTTSLSEAAGWLTTLGTPSLRAHRSRERAIDAIERAVAALAPSAAQPSTDFQNLEEDDGDAAAAEAYAQFRNLSEVQRAINSGALSASTAYALESAGRRRVSYLAHLKKLMEAEE